MILGLRTFLKNKKILNRTIAGAISSVIFLLLVSPVSAQTDIAYAFGGGLIALFNTLLYVILQTIVFALITAVGILINIGQYPVALDDNIITVGWVVLRDIGNMFFVVILLLISFGTILRLDQYQLKNLLPKVILMAVLVNFSKLIAGVFIEISQIVMLTFVVAYSAAGAGNFMNAMQIPNLTQIWTPSDIQNLNTAEPLGHADVFTSLVGGIIYAAIAVVVVLAYIAIFAVRLVALWILVVFSPFAFALNVIPAGQKYASMWWEQFSKYIIVGPVLAFFLWLSLATLPMILDQSGSNNAGTRGADEVAYVQSIEKNIPGAGSTEALQPVSFLKFILSSVMLIMSLYFAQQIGGTVGNIARMGMSSLSTLGKNAGGLRPLARYWDERRGLKGKVSVNPYTYIDAWKRQREITKKERTTGQVAFAEAVAKQGVAKSVYGNVLNRLTGSTIMSNIEEFEQALKELKAKRSRGQGLDTEQRKQQYRSNYEEIKRKKEYADSDVTDFSEFMGLDEDRYTAGRLWSGDDFKKKRERYDALSLRFGSFATPQNANNEEYEESKTNQGKELARLKLILDNEEDPEKGLNAQFEKAKKEKEIAEAQDADKQIAEILKKESEDRVKAKELEIRILNNNLMGLGEVEEKIGETNKEIGKVEQLLKRLQAMGGDTKDIEKADEQKKALEGTRAMLVKYSDNIKNGQLDLDNDKLGIEHSRENFVSAKSDIDRAAIVKDVNKELGIARAQFEAEAFSEEDMERYEKEEKILEERVRSEKVRLAKMAIPTYYQEKARRSMVGEKLKELAGIEDSDELIAIFEKAEAMNDKYMIQAVANKLAGDGNHNDLLNHFGYNSGFNGMKKFYQERIAKALGNGNAARGQEDAMRLARDISYIAENINHRDISRVIGTDLNGKMRWYSEYEHAIAALSEINKLNPQKIKRDFNRLAVMGETPLPNGDRVPEWGMLAQLFTLSQYDNLYSAATFGGDLQKNLAINMFKAMSGLPQVQLMQDDLETLRRRLGIYIHETRDKSGKK